MHRTRILGVVALIAAALGMLSLRLVLLDVTDARAASPSNGIDIMQMMREVKDLPVQAYDAV
jgi:hypothetical protein